MSAPTSPDYYPPPAFSFRVTIAGMPGPGQAFQEVSGIESILDTEGEPEGGGNRFVHRLPSASKSRHLELKRGTAPLNSPLLTWCRSILESGLNAPISPKQISVHLLDPDDTPLRGWSFDDAYPLRWTVDAFSSTKSEVSIESISLTYSAFRRIL